MRTISKFSHRVACFAIIQEEIRIRAHTREMVSRWRIFHILNKFTVRVDHLQDMK